MVEAYDVAGLSSTVFGIAGMGIGLGLLAGTSRNLMRMSESDYWGRNSNRPRQVKYRERAPRRQYQTKPNFYNISIPRSSFKGMNFKW